MAQDQIAPIALPAGSFEARDLQKALDGAVSVKDAEKRPERINQAIVNTILQPEILANADLPAIPFGAEEVDRKIVYREGDDPVDGKAVAFTPVKADDGEAASKMSYVLDEKKDVAVGSSDPVASPPSAARATTLNELAAAAVASDEGKAKTSN